MKDIGIKKIYLAVLILEVIIFSALSSAQPDLEDIGAVVDESVHLGPLQPVQEIVVPFLKRVSALVGGIFGLYFILVVVRIYYERKNFKTLKEIKSEVVHLNSNMDIKIRRKS